MSLFSLNWFKSNKKKEELEIKKLELEIKQQELAVKSEEIYQNRLIQEKLEPNVKEEHKQLSADELFINMKPYLNIKLVNDTLTVVLLDGNIFSKPNATIEDFKRAREASNDDELFSIISTPEIAKERSDKKIEIEKAKSIIKGLDLLKQFKDFDVIDNSVYFKGINRTLPQILIEELLIIINKLHVGTVQETEKVLATNDDYQSLKRFFMWCCLNPRAEVANELYRFLKDNSFRITKQGFFVALRNVVTVETDGDKKIIDFISNTYNKIKAVWKKNPDNYRVVQTEDGEYKFELTSASLDGKTIIGNLTTLYLNLPNMAENRYTDDWTKTFDIRIGKLVNMPMEKCNWSTQDCAAAGLN